MLNPETIKSANVILLVIALILTVISLIRPTWPLLAVALLLVIIDLLIR